MKLGFMTLGCPKWTLDDICRNGRPMGFDAVDFRGLGETIDITTLPAFTTGVAATKSKLNSAGLEVSCISSSISVCDAAKRQANLDEAKRTIGVAVGLGATRVRVFGNGDVSGGHLKAAEIGRECVREILSLPGARDVVWCFETHDHWIKGEHARLLLDAIEDPAFGALWDMGHTFRVGKEPPERTLELIGPRIAYAHVKDATHDASHPLAMGDGWRYVVPGTGQLPLAESIRRLAATGYDGYLTFEHEKRWVANLPEPEEMFPKFVAWVRSLPELKA